jgi:hypothetical protein
VGRYRDFAADSRLAGCRFDMEHVAACLSIRDQVPALEKDLPAGDRRRLRDYLDQVREIERRVNTT